MIDLYKYSKKNKLFEYIVFRILKIDINFLTRPLFSQFSVDINFDRNFFYDYKKKFPETKWMKFKNALKFYQSNHDLEKYKEMKFAKKSFEKLLNKDVKKNIFKKNIIGKFKIKNMWFTIQGKNEGHHSHNHPKSILSGVYYFEVQRDSGGEINLELENKKITYSPKKNDLIIFNSSVFHSVNPYLGDKDRIAVAWDAIYTL